MSTQPLTPTEQAAARIIGIASDAGTEYVEKAARKVVAAVEQSIAVAALESVAAALDELAATNARVGRGTAEGPWIAAGVQGAALHVRSMIRARQSLSRPTSEEH